MKRAVLLLGILSLIFAALLSYQFGNSKADMQTTSDTEESDYEYYGDENDVSGDGNLISQTKNKNKKLIAVDTKADSISVLVNRKYRMDKDYIPADLVVPNVRFSFYGICEKSYVRQITADALEKLFTEAEQAGVIFKAVSGYRSYERQEQIYNRNVSSRGSEETDKVSAQPGASEHQTGLAIDISSESVDCDLTTALGDTPEGKWLAQNCYKYGFIIRYPKGKSAITGYSYEPWHIRYVGLALAKYLYKKEMTLEEYYQTTTVGHKIKEKVVAIHDVDDEEEPQMTSAPTPRPTKKPVITKQPQITEQPTQKPAKKKKPAVTKKPGATKKPVATKNPVATQKPVVTAEPAQPEVTDPPVIEEPSDNGTTQTQETTEGTQPVTQ